MLNKFKFISFFNISYPLIPSTNFILRFLYCLWFPYICPTYFASITILVLFTHFASFLFLDNDSPISFNFVQRFKNSFNFIYTIYLFSSFMTYFFKTSKFFFGSNLLGQKEYFPLTIFKFFFNNYDFFY